MVALQYYGENVSMLTSLLSFMIVTELSVLNLPIYDFFKGLFLCVYLPYDCVNNFDDYIYLGRFIRKSAKNN